MIENTKDFPFLTTIDNVWNPFTNFDEWFAFDLEKQHYSNQVLAKVALTSDLLSEEENRQEVERAIDRIIELDPLKEFVKVYPDTFNEDMAKAKQNYLSWYNSQPKETKSLFDSKLIELIEV